MCVFVYNIFHLSEAYCILMYALVYSGQDPAQSQSRIARLPFVDSAYMKGSLEAVGAYFQHSSPGGLAPT